MPPGSVEGERGHDQEREREDGQLDQHGRTTREKWRDPLPRRLLLGLLFLRLPPQHGHDLLLVDQQPIPDNPPATTSFEHQTHQHERSGEYLVSAEIEVERLMFLRLWPSSALLSSQP